MASCNISGTLQSYSVRDGRNGQFGEFVLLETLYNLDGEEYATIHHQGLCFKEELMADFARTAIGSKLTVAVRLQSNEVTAGDGKTFHSAWLKAVKFEKS